jgi:hypothetical protein
MRRIYGSRGVEISILLLCGADFFNEAVDVGLELWIGRNAERVRCPLNYFVNVGVVERIWRIFVVFKWLAAQRLGRANEVVDAPSFLVFLECERNSNLTIDLNARRPKSVVDMNRSRGNRLDWIVTSLRPADGEQAE